MRTWRSQNRPCAQSSPVIGASTTHNAARKRRHPRTHLRARSELRSSRGCLTAFRRRTTRGPPKRACAPAVESLRNTEQNTLFDAASAYMDVIRDRQIAILRERNLEFLEEQVRAARSRFEVGEGTRTDVAQAEASRSSGGRAACGGACPGGGKCRRPIARSSATTPVSWLCRAAAKGLPKSLDRRLRSPLSSILRSLPLSIWSTRPASRSRRRKALCCRSCRPRRAFRAAIAKSRRHHSSTDNDPISSASAGLTLTVPIYQGGRVSALVRQSKESLGQARIEVDVTPRPGARRGHHRLDPI